MLPTARCIILAAALAQACSSDKGPLATERPSDAGRGKGAGGGSSGGSPGAGGLPGSAGGTAGAGTANGGSNSGAGGVHTVLCPPSGVRLPSNTACYIGCTYDFGSPPRYEAAGGPCTAAGWKCSTLQYCNPNIHCLDTASCQQLGGAGWVCVPTPTGPLVGECAIECMTDADCPDSKGKTPSPYTCKAVDNGTTVVRICRF